ncbi:hypothetical protein Tco_1355012 [Tanacetum coccineum]
MKRPTKGYSGQEVALFPTMLDVTEPSTSPSRITSSPSPSPEPSPSHSPDPSTQHSPEHTTAASQPDPLTTGRKSDAEDQGKASTETEPIIQEVTPTEVIQDQRSSEKGNSERRENISTAGRTVTYRRRSEEERTRKDKGKAIMTEPEPKKKSKKEIEQERLSFAEAIRWDEEERQRAISEAKSTKEIDWNDPLVIRYHALKMKPKTVAQARRNMIKYLKNQGNYKISDIKGMSLKMRLSQYLKSVGILNQHIEPIGA